MKGDCWLCLVVTWSNRSSLPSAVIQSEQRRLPQLRSCLLLHTLYTRPGVRSDIMARVVIGSKLRHTWHRQQVPVLTFLPHAKGLERASLLDTDRTHCTRFLSSQDSLHLLLLPALTLCLNLRLLDALEYFFSLLFCNPTCSKELLSFDFVLLKPLLEVAAFFVRSSC